jgi:hemerythrin-like domain-containing protein
MLPRGPLMIEHRLIEKMLAIIDTRTAVMQTTREIDPVFIDSAVDFIRMYADRTHHGKEEDILFRDLEKKEMSPRDTKMMRELLDEHEYARKKVSDLIDAKSRYVKGDASAVNAIIECLRALVSFYPGHIIKEDKTFFPNTEKYFTAAELARMLDEFWEFDRGMIHEKYNGLVKDLSANG